MKSADIYLCDSCDSHFDNLEVLRAHERLCNNEEVPSSTCSGGLPEFLAALKLQSVNVEGDNFINKNRTNEARPRNVRSAANIDRGPPYPFSSLAYMRNAKSNTQRDTTYSRERIERYCCTPLSISKTLASKSKNQQFPIRYRRPMDYWHRKHTFPNQRNKRILDLKGQLLFLKCRPVSVDIEIMSMKKIEEYIENLKIEAERQRELEKDIIFVDCEQSVYVEPRSADPLKRMDVDEVIDLCSDDESPVNENCDPRAGVAGVACVMRGGAVLRRTAATPRLLPAEPCGARQRPLPAAVLQPHPHPVILISHTLNNLQTISLD